MEWRRNPNIGSLLNWSNATQTIQDDGATRTLIVNLRTGNCFNRPQDP